MSEGKNKEEYPVADLASILSVNDKVEEWVNIPEWKMRVKVRSITKADQVKLRKQSTVRGEVDVVKMEQQIFLYGLAEPKIEAEHLDRLFEKQSGAVDRILNAIFQVSGMTADVDEAEADFQE